GLYTQPLGFVLLSAWLVIYLGSDPTGDGGGATLGWRFALSAILLALTVLSNFFSAITAAVFIAAALAIDVFAYWRGSRRQHNFILHLVSPLVAFFLAAFWLVPMMTQYGYFVTRPHAPGLRSMFSVWLVAWYAIAILGCVISWRELRKKQPQPMQRRTKETTIESSAANAARAYLVACAILLASVVFSAIAPGWFPLQTPRFISTLTFLLTAPVGFALAAGFRSLAKLLGESSTRNQTFRLRRIKFSLGIAAVIFLIVVLTAPTVGWAYTFYPKGQKSAIDDVLSFARAHRDGRYLVEVINPQRGPAWTEASGDARAINSYLGSQGNETISGVFHEASPNALFTLPVVNAFSNYPDSFGVSSVLADDLDFSSQPLSEQVKRAQFLGVKYLLIRTPAMKERISKEITSAIRHDIGWWAIFELRDAPAPTIQALQNKPALVVSDFTVKARRRNEMSFTRLVEEQFADNWFEVLLARSAEKKIDRLSELEHFGALILQDYDYADENAAFEVLRNFARNHPLICFSSDKQLFRRIEQSRDQFATLTIIATQPEAPGEVVEALQPTYHYGSTEIRKQWKQVRRVLERMIIPTNASPYDVEGELDQERINVSSRVAGVVPVLIANTFHPAWRRTDTHPLYAATPFYTLTFVDKSATIVYGRRWFDRIGLWVSVVTGALVCFGLLWKGRSLFQVRLCSQETRSLPPR
ncbi:MAG TPA: hypothetical protein VFT02_10260, partial [Pyrinomonadaceae bacterium]|nr:hypothetical protein [Pyrinomonadaceae bacterium]